MFVQRRMAAAALAATVLVTTEAVGDDPVLVGAGDISSCFTDADEETAKLLDSIPGTVFTAGDAVYPDGSPEPFAECFAPTWEYVVPCR